MTIVTKEEQVTEQKIQSIICNKCKKKILPSDYSEWEEIFWYKSSGGYGSIIGDSVTFSVELCQHCFVELLGEYLEFPEE